MNAYLQLLRAMEPISLTSDRRQFFRSRRKLADELFVFEIPHAIRACPNKYGKSSSGKRKYPAALELPA
jgi:hypothetical protein